MTIASIAPTPSPTIQPSQTAGAGAVEMLKIYEFAGLYANFTTGEVKIAGRRVELTGKELQVLRFLCANKATDEPVRTGMIMDHLYGDDAKKPKIVHVFICGIRKKIAAVSNDANYIKWHRGTGRLETDGKGYQIIDPAKAVAKELA